MEIFFSLVTLAGMGYGVFMGVKWMLKAGQLTQKREQPLSPTDLKVLEESAERLMNDLRAAADECVARVELALTQAESRIRAIDQQVAMGPIQQEPTVPIVVQPMPSANPSTTQRPESPAQTARQAGMTTGELELMRGLRQFGAK